MVNSVGDVYSKRLPSLIRVAQRRAQEVPEVHAVKQGPLLVSALLAFTNLDQVDEPLRFGRQKLAAILGVTTRTVDRRLVELEQAGLAARVTPRRKVGGRWPVCRLRWSASALLAFWPDGLPLPRLAAPTDHRSADPGQTVARAPQWVGRQRKTGARLFAVGKTGLSHRSSGEDLGSKESGVAGSAKLQAPPPPGLRGLPEDLHWLVLDHGLRHGQVCTLMARCRDRGQRLQDVLAVAACALADRRGDRAMGLLLRLTQADRDYAAVRRRGAERRARTERSARRGSRERSLLAAVQLGVTLPGLGRVVDRGEDHIVVESGGVRSVADARTLARAVGHAAGWRGLLSIRRRTFERLTAPRPEVPAGCREGRREVPAELRALTRSLLRFRPRSAFETKVQSPGPEVGAHLVVGACPIPGEPG